MAKEKQTKEEKKLYVGIVWHYTAELKLLLTALLILCTLATLLQFIPPSRFTISTSDLRVCISRVLSPSSQPQPQPQDQPITTTTSTTATPAVDISAPPPLFSPPAESVDPNGIIKRVFDPHGAAAYSYISMGAYRGGMNTFAIIGIASKPLHVYSNPTYQCRWIPAANSSAAVSAAGYKMLPDWGYGRVYTVVIVNCTFPHPVNSDNSGGKLVLLASTSGGGDRNFNVTDEIEALTESPGSLNPSVFTSRPKYDYLYCGSSLYGNLSPQRVREWIAYHVRLFGPRSHFVIHDAGGIHEEVLEVLKPWMELGYVTLQDIRDQERFDGYYHNQFMVVNDCLHRYKFTAKWMFFFDVDEYIYMPPKSTIKTVLDSLAEYTQFTIEQMPMSNKLCLLEDYHKTNRKWGFEKLVYKDVKKGIRRDRKYAVQPRNVYATGVHMSQNVAGKTTHKTENRIKYFHYHGTIADRREPCKKLINDTQIFLDKVPYVQDTTMRDVAGAVKRFEQRMIGSRLQQTRQ
ncbi:galactan beta-1,4-galactosyltransferase GALS3-like [Argentina anserina]|uniref:galactan beta-1,4-galactosyltransferase GALS3-like n=1 Tax=Argentina anserina TaxID=57926 RepID=UPI002176565B|nr:galactan beta-1,4-galactosyltransferase GALS3-like [Potentilla anserina]